MERSFQHRRTHHIAYKKTRQINVNAQIASIDFVRILHLFFLFSSSIRLFFPLYRSNFYESIDRANLWVKKNALYRITKLSRSMLMTKLHWLRSSFFPFFIFVISINFFHSIILSTNIHMHIAISIFLRNH